MSKENTAPFDERARGAVSRRPWRSRQAFESRSVQVSSVFTKKEALVKRILVGGIGNVVFGDDAFGIETARSLMDQELDREVRVAIFHTRTDDLVYAMTGGYRTIILVDAIPRGYTPGTLYLIEPDLQHLQTVALSKWDELDPISMLQLAQKLGAVLNDVYLIGCEPEVRESEGRIGLSPVVKAAVPQAVRIVQSIIKAALMETSESEIPLTHSIGQPIPAHFQR